MSQSLGNFAADILEYVMTKAETTDIKSGPDPFKGYVIKVGKDQEFTGPEAFQRFFEWIATRKATFSTAEIEAAADDAARIEDEAFQGEITRLTSEGMTDMGKAIDSLRKKRTVKMEEAVLRLKGRGLIPTTLESAIDLLRLELPGEEIDLEDLAVVMHLWSSDEVLSK